MDGDANAVNKVGNICDIELATIKPLGVEVPFKELTLSMEVLEEVILNHDKVIQFEEAPSMKDVGVGF